MKILVVDDSKVMRAMVIRAMRQAGFGSHDFDQAGNGVEALQAIDAAKPDLILSDWNMPEMSGIELLHSLKEKGLAIKFGFVTSEGTEKTVQEGSDAGSLFHITKPFTPEKFQDALEPVIA